MATSEQPVIVGLGEVLFDIVGEVEALGGAPANFAYHAGRLGANAYIVSTVGGDERGSRALRELQERGLNTECITIAEQLETGYVRAEIDQDGIASYHFPANIAWDNLELNPRALEVAAQADGVCFGSLAQRSEVSKKVIQHFLELVPENCLKVYDINLRQDFYTPEIIQSSLNAADIIKLNDEELPVVAKMLDLAGNELDLLKSLRERFSLQLAVLTRGDKGSLLVAEDGYSDHPGIAIEHLQDTIGAGDSFTASVLMNFLAGKPLDTINEEANKVAALICSHRGAMPRI